MRPTLRDLLALTPDIATIVHLVRTEKTRTVLRVISRTQLLFVLGLPIVMFYA
jgi:hypothetical protein